MLSIPPPQRPPSRSERLLRETLRRDEEVRDSGAASPKRRHSLSRHSSRVASPPPPPLPPLDFCSRPPSPARRCRYADLADEQYARGAFMFRSPVNSGPTSPPPSGYIPGNVYEHLPRQGASESSDGTATPGSRTRFHNGHGPHTSSRLSTRSISPPPAPTRTTTVTRRHSLQRAFYHEPLTPQEHALRARLESALRPEDNRLSSHMTNANLDWARDRNSQLQWRDSNFTARSGSVSQPQSGASILSTPPPSSPPRLHSSSSPSLQDPGRTHTRSRSSTDPILPSHYPYANISSYSTTRARTGTNTTSPTTSSSSTSMSSLSPRRNAAASNSHPSHHSHQSQTHLHQQSRRKHINMEATPPLTADASPTGISEGNELEPEYQLDDADDDSRLITPPPSPPHFNGVSRQTHHLPHAPLPYRPMGEWYPVFAVPGSDAVNPDTHAHTSLSPNPVRPQFNVRKASEQCKMIDGYVSFVSIEGLGGPPESNSPALGDDGEEDKRNRDKRMFGIGWDRWRKLLPLAVGGANAGEHESAMSR